MTELIINKRGTLLSIKDGRFQVKNAERSDTIPFSTVKSIALHPSTRLTFEAVKYAVENDIDFLFFDRKGHPIARIWSNKFGSIATVRKNQLLFSQDEQQALQWIKNLLADKLENQSIILSLIALRTESTQEKLIATAIAKIKALKQKILKLQPTAKNEDFNRLRGLEGMAADAYFRTISITIPEQYKFDGRSRQPACDMFNALLNYAYGILYARVETALIEAGIDPGVGLFHRDEYNRPVFTYDFIERYRHWADYVVIDLCMQQAVFIEFFDLEHGGFYLNEHGKKILITGFNDYMDEVIELNNNQRSRLSHIKMDAQKLATKFKSYKP